MNRIMLLGTKTARDIASVLFVYVALLIYWHANSTIDFLRATHQPDVGTLEPVNLPRRDLPGANETVVVLKTGSPELEDRFAVHLSTSLRCFQHYLLFWDLEEWYYGEHMRDALSFVDITIKANHEDFEIYRRLQRDGRAGLRRSELSGSAEAFSKKTGNVENPSWKLDQWKFMPMVNQTLHNFPNMKWYVFMMVLSHRSPLCF